MKNTPSALKAALSKPGTSTCFLVKIVTTNNQVYGFGTLDTSIQYNDDLHTVIYSASEELRPQNIQYDTSMNPDNTDLLGWFSDAIENKILSGLFDSAEVTIYRVCYLKLELGHEIVAYGNVGDIDLTIDKKSKRKIEFKSLKQQLQQAVSPFFSLTCRAEFGDERCGMPFVWEDGTVSSVDANPYLSFTLTGISRPDNYFALGVIQFTSGDNYGATLEVESWSTAGHVKLSFPAPFPIIPTTTVKIRQDCDKTSANCKAYGNIINMRAEHLTPVEDGAVMIPGAYIPSAGAL